MEKDENQKRAIEIAEAEVSYWREEVVRAKERSEKEIARYQEVAEKFRTAAEFLGLVEERYGRSVKSGPTQLPPGAKLGEAALDVVRQKGRATREEIVAELRARGFEFGRYPARQLHFALLNSDRVIREPSGAWRWKGADQKEMALASEGAREPTRE